ncbi:glutathione S-transferase 1-like [Parasteatoda tepidariorum]|uniref:glutathione S-transferase 1-like n=1 Tax=Parasteatoda tepidariorum TaxID=114398 RepID=UPI001C7296A6|nr:glutathione S-transferase 1-like [Parasteatoda tepidariorum]XP_042895347.1 glutathione S-transferase 1-like [Parasteatoda tepidariorum]
MGIILYEMECSPPCAAVRMTLGHLGIKVESKLLDYYANDHMKPEYLKINPQHIVPTIDDKGLILWESRAILSYIVDKYAPGNPLYPKDVKERAIIDRLLYFDIGTLYKAITDYMYPTFFLGQPPDSEKKEAADKAIGFLEGFLSQTSYVAGNHLTIADFSIFASLTYPLFFDYGLTAFPKVTAWMNKIKSQVPEYKELIETPMTKMIESMKSDKQA